MPATFIGHFLFDEPIDEAVLDAKVAELPTGSPRIAIMPGSRPDELRRNYPMMLEVFAKVREKHPGAIAVVAATRPAVAEQLQVVAVQLADRLGLGHVENNGWPESMRCVVATDVVIRWCELSLVKSGTVTMQVAKQLRPMVIVYKKSNPLLYYVVKAIMATKLFTLPNVIGTARSCRSLCRISAGRSRSCVPCWMSWRSPGWRPSMREELARSCRSLRDATCGSWPRMRSRNAWTEIRRR